MGAVPQSAAEWPAWSVPAACQAGDSQRQRREPQGVPLATMLRQIAPQQSAPQQTAPLTAAPQQTMPQQPALRQTAQQQTAPQQSIPQQPAPLAAAPRQTAQKAVPPVVQPLPVPAARPSPRKPQQPQAHTAAKGKRKPSAPVSPEAVIAQKRDALEQRQTVRAFLLKLAVIAAMGYLLCTQVFGFAAMTGEQMYPRIRDGDLMLYYRLAKDYSISDVLTFSRGGARYTGRVVARGGDTVTINDLGQLLVNDNVQTEEIFYPTTAAENEQIRFPLAIPEHSYFLLCDMRTQATDSRTYGAVAQDEIEGKVISVLRRRGI